MQMLHAARSRAWQKPESVPEQGACMQMLSFPVPLGRLQWPSHVWQAVPCCICPPLPAPVLESSCVCLQVTVPCST